MDEADDRALVVAMPSRDLQAAGKTCDRLGSVVLPAGSPGALDEASPGTPVLVLAVGAGALEAHAATWSATYAGRVPHDAGEPFPEGLPETWLETHDSAASTPAPSELADPGGDDEEEEDDDVGPQSFFRVTELRQLPRDEWVFANELVPKQQRGGRTFVPRAPTLVPRPD